MISVEHIRKESDVVLKTDVYIPIITLNKNDAESCAVFVFLPVNRSVPLYVPTPPRQLTSKDRDVLLYTIDQ